MSTGLILVLLVALLAFPRHAATQDAAQGAQRATVVRALADLRTALDGTYGDEGGEIARRLGDLSEAVASWDRSIRETELKLRPRLEGASPDEAALAHEALGSMYMERGRFADAVTEFEAASRVAPQRASLHLSRAFALDAIGSH